MTVYNVLGVFEEIYGKGAEMSLSRAALISVVGILIVFVILGILAVFVKAMGFGFDRLHETRRARMLANAPKGGSALWALPGGAPSGAEPLSVAEGNAAIPVTRSIRIKGPTMGPFLFAVDS